ncbi:hypoxanthine phosphoribosyltransferase [Bdellovibrio bacteriovorus]|uniref:Hypoxanthine phosphoribosyltransferase n=1 Tax=Bdellovibrio bacteriovorus TaxID=959 RepID=A0A150WCV1_BDEBC|nr:hypoxanthine phosphoribosyltransferase [Bdellovibrio bacteriovorus]KYG60721.1 hypoxanthine phosphoribosyltransferase [Bdellovibrio bacteriovorus]KYG69075.1 hypoxanthine phosphoribosyltransferase [Bdellovibrio bacteriovorus]
MAQLKEQMVPFLTSDEIAEIVESLAEQIESDYDGKDVVFICPLRGSIHFTADLMRKVDLPQQVDFVHVQAVEKGGAIKIVKDISVNIAGKHVLIVEEIIDTGRTLSFLRSRLFASAPASLKIVTLLDKPARRELPIKADYIGRTIDDRYVVGYGMDSEEVGRNYPDIYTMKN